MTHLCTYVPLSERIALNRACISHEETFCEIRFIKVHRYISCLAIPSIAIYKPDYRKLFRATNGHEPGQIWGYRILGGHGVKYYHGR